MPTLVFIIAPRIRLIQLHPVSLPLIVTLALACVYGSLRIELHLASKRASIAATACTQKHIRSLTFADTPSTCLVGSHGFRFCSPESPGMFPEWHFAITIPCCIIFREMPWTCSWDFLWVVRCAFDTNLHALNYTAATRNMPCQHAGLNIEFQDWHR